MPQVTLPTLRQSLERFYSFLLLFKIVSICNKLEVERPCDSLNYLIVLRQQPVTTPVPPLSSVTSAKPFPDRKNHPLDGALMLSVPVRAEEQPSFRGAGLGGRCLYQPYMVVAAH